MKIDAQKSVRALAMEIPYATTIFDRFGINYAGEGNRSLWEACTSVGVAVSEVVRLLKQAEEISLTLGEDKGTLILPKKFINQ